MYLSQEQVTNILEMHPITISKAIKTEKLPAEQKNVKWQICSKDLFDYAREWDRNQSRVLRVENMLKENQKLFFTKHDTTKILKISPLTLSKMFFHAEKIQEKWKQKQFSRDELLEIAVELDRRYLKVPKVLRALRRLKEQFSEKPKVLTLTEAGILVEKDRNVIKYAIEKKKILPASKSKEGKYQISFEDLKEYALRHLHKQI